MLGGNFSGVVEPIKAGVDAGVRLGVGKQEQDDKHTNEATQQRKRLESEVQLTEDEERTRRREVGAAACCCQLPLPQARPHCLPFSIAAT
jgi:hypothetical protein